MNDSLALYIECTKTDGEEITLTFFNAVENISSEFLKGAFLTAARPVLKLDKIISAYYVNTKNTPIIESE